MSADYGRDHGTPARELHDAVWTRLRADTDAFRTRHPDTDSTTRLLWDLLVAAYARGARHQTDRPGHTPTDAAIVAEVMGFAQHANTAPTALRDLARGGLAAAAAAASVEGGGQCDG